MTFKTLVILIYGFLQLYILSRRKTLSMRSVLFLFVLGALGSFPVAIALETILSHYLDGSSLLPYVSCQGFSGVVLDVPD
jgi:hypothetical protein